MTVTATGAHAFAIVFGNTGNEPAIVATANVPEVETLDVQLRGSFGDGKLYAHFQRLDGDAGGKCQRCANRLGAQCAAVDQSHRRRQLGQRYPWFRVAVPDQFTITFNSFGEQSIIAAVGSIAAEDQKVEVFAPITNAVPGMFTLSFERPD